MLSSSSINVECSEQTSPTSLLTGVYTPLARFVPLYPTPTISRSRM
jgi:hypothetical protein